LCELHIYPTALYWFKVSEKAAREALEWGFQSPAVTSAICKADSFQNRSTKREPQKAHLAELLRSE
jgi:hypothetical protein